jgi:ureidoacrylate peracid hydrolase
MLKREGKVKVEITRQDRLALVIHDMLNDGHKPGGKMPNAGKVPGSAEYFANQRRLLLAARAHGLPIFYTGHALRPDHLDTVRLGNSWKHSAYLAGTWGAEVIDELKPEPGDWIIRKGGGMSAFTGTPFEKWLNRLNITHIMIAGGSTNSGVESTVRDARDRDFYTIVVSDACRSNSPPHHDASLFNMALFSQIGTVNEVIAALEHRQADR